LIDRFVRGRIKAMFYEVRCGDLFPGKQLVAFDVLPVPGARIPIGDRMFVVWQVTPQAGTCPLVELAVDDD
jgi:hypothetical protein